MSYDRRCLDLAQYFLADEPSAGDDADEANELAQVIQSTVEDFIEDKRRARTNHE